MPRDIGVGVCVSRLDMSAGSSVDSGREISWNGSMGLGSGPPGNPEFTFCCKMGHDVVPQEVKIVSGPFLPLCQLW